MKADLQAKVSDIRNLFEAAEEEQGEVALNLRLTNACGFACAHCMFSSHPLSKAHEKWMSNADIDSIMALAGELEQAGYSVCLNLIGGEPTKDLQQFSRILNCFSNHSACGRVNFEMTTNGWFLRSWESLCKFAAAAGQFIREREMSIRISNTDYHDPFRSYVEKRLMFEDTKPRDCGGGERKVSRLESALECPFDHYEFQAACPECEAALSGMVCSKCGLELSEDDYAEAQDKGCAAPGHEWIAELLKAAKEGRFYVDRRSPGEAKISPVGRAAKNGIGYQACECWDGRAIFTIEPGGDLQGVCCTGGHVPIGNVRDGAWQLYALASLYIRAIKQRYPGKTSARCQRCSAFAAGWVPQNKANLLSLIQNVEHEAICA